MNRIGAVIVVLMSLVLSVSLRGQDVGFANAWPELTASDQEQVQKLDEEGLKPY